MIEQVWSMSVGQIFSEPVRIPLLEDFLLVTLVIAIAAFAHYAYMTAMIDSSKVTRGVAVRGRVCTALSLAIIGNRLSLQYFHDPLSSAIIAVLCLLFFSPLPQVMLADPETEES